jgi:hypothetical protein
MKVQCSYAAKCPKSSHECCHYKIHEKLEDDLCNSDHCMETSQDVKCIPIQSDWD